MISPITLADLNQFLILQIEPRGDRTLITGRLRKPGQPSVDGHVNLFINMDEDVSGYLTELDPDASRAVFSTATEHLHPSIVLGTSFPMYDSYWSGRIRLVLDKGIRWTRQQFTSPDAFEQASPQGGRMWRVAQPGDENRSDGKIVPGGWDHEHCELCWGKIGSGGDPEGYSSGRGDVNISNRYGWTPLMFAALRGHKSLVALLLDMGADVNAVAHENGYSALANAAQAGHVEVVQLLLDAGATVKVPDSLCGGSLLLYVTSGRGHNDLRISQLLIGAGAK